MRSFITFLKENNELENIIRALPDEVYTKISNKFGEEEAYNVFNQIAGYIYSLTPEPQQVPELWKKFENVATPTDAWRIYQQYRTPQQQPQQQQPQQQQTSRQNLSPYLSKHGKMVKGSWWTGR